MLAALGVAVTLALVGGLALWILSNLTEALRTGSAKVRRRTYSERQTPVQFWLSVSGQLLILLGCLYVLVRVVGSWSV